MLNRAICELCTLLNREQMVYNIKQEVEGW